MDVGSALYLRPQFGIGVYTVLARIAGRPVGVIANNPRHLGGAIDADAALKAARFIELCDAFDIAIVNLVDCPGFMVGPDSEKQGESPARNRDETGGISIGLPSPFPHCRTNNALPCYTR